MLSGINFAAIETLARESGPAASSPRAASRSWTTHAAAPRWSRTAWTASSRASALYEGELDLPRRHEAAGQGGGKETMTLAKRLIPCLDVDRGPRGQGRATSSPCATPAIRWSARPATTREGADELVFLDITACSDARAILLDDDRGGWRTRCSSRSRWAAACARSRTCDALLSAGADKVGVNTAAVSDPALLERLAERFGAQAVVLAIDARAMRGTARAGRSSCTAAARPPASTPWPGRAKAAERGAGEILLTSMDRDGTQGRLRRGAHPRGGSDAVTRAGDRLRAACGTVAHMAEVLTEGKASAALAASVFHFGEIRIADAKARAPRRPGWRCG